MLRKSTLVLVAFLMTASAGAALAQVSFQRTQPPAVTAENRQWYLNGEPVAYGGSVYYPSGPIRHFDLNEMVESGTFDGVPIYARKTVEVGSMIFVPLAGGVMRPYEQRRSGDLAGTSGSSAPSFVVQPPQPYGLTYEPPAFVYAPPDTITRRPISTVGYTTTGSTVSSAAAPAVPIGTAGAATEVVLAAPSGPTRIQTVQRPIGLNKIFLEFQGTRWFAAGPAVELSADRFKKIGEYRGFPVYAEPAHPDTIYVALVAGAPGLVSPYKKR